jgi:hypothetical protein
MVIAGMLAVLLTIACGDDDDSGGSGDGAASPTETPARAGGETIDIETFAAGDEYTVELEEMSGSGASGTAVITGIADGDASIVVEMDGVSEGGVNLYGGLNFCPESGIPPDAEAILTLAPLLAGVSETSPVGVSTETFSGDDIFVFSGPWAIIVKDSSGAPAACGMIPQE